jgi:hypothetical protein
VGDEDNRPSCLDLSGITERTEDTI